MVYTDSVSRKFLEYSSPGWRNDYANVQPNKYLDFQDPTYLGFYVRFLGLNEAPFDGLDLDYEKWPGGLFYNEKHKDSAIGYLVKIGEYGRAQMLREFVLGIKELSVHLPWYFTKVSGLDAIWKINPAESFRGKDKVITFDMEESIDLKITYLLDLYRKAVYDSVYMRYMLPENLRYFEMEIVITEIRSMQRPSPKTPVTNKQDEGVDNDQLKNPLPPNNPLNTVLPGLTDSAINSATSALIPNSQWSSTLSNALTASLRRDPGANSSYPVDLANFDQMASFLVFNFAHCEFEVFTEAPVYFGELGKTAGSPAKNKILIKTPIVREFNSYGMLGALLEDTPDLITRSKEKVDGYFWKQEGKTLAAPPAEAEYLRGVKNELFDLTQQTKKQNRLKEENQRLGGVLGELLSAAVNTATSALNQAITGAVSRALLGNVFSETFGPTVGQQIADKVMLQAPPIIQQVLTQVALNENGATSEGPAQPAAVDLSGAETVIAPLGIASLEGAPLSASTPGQTFLQSAPTSNPTLTRVSLEGAEPSSEQPGSTTLTDVPLSPLLSTRVVFDSAEINTAPPGTVEQIAPSVQISPDKTVELESALPLASTDKTVELEAPPVNTRGDQSVEFEGAITNVQSGGNVDFESTPPANTEPGAVVLTEASTETPISANVELVGAKTTAKPGGVVALDAPEVNDNIEKTVELESVKIGGLANPSVNFESTPTPAIAVGSVALNEPPVLINPIENIRLEAPAISTMAGDRVELTEPPTTKTGVTSVFFVEPTKANAEPQKIELEAPAKKLVELQPVEFDSIAIRSEVAITKQAVVLQDNGAVLEGNPGRILLEEPIKTAAELSRKDAIENVDNVRIDKEQEGSYDTPQKPGKVQMKEATKNDFIVPPSIKFEEPESNTQFLGSVILEEPLQITHSLSTADVTAPDVQEKHPGPIEFESASTPERNLSSVEFTQQQTLNSIQPAKVDLGSPQKVPPTYNIKGGK